MQIRRSFINYVRITQSYKMKILHVVIAKAQSMSTMLNRLTVTYADVLKMLIYFVVVIIYVICAMWINANFVYQFVLDVKVESTAQLVQICNLFLAGIIFAIVAKQTSETNAYTAPKLPAISAKKAKLLFSSKTAKTASGHAQSVQRYQKLNT